MALALTVTLVVAARALGGEAPARFATMALGFILIVASLAGEAGEALGLPRLTLHLLVGLLAGPEVLGLITPDMTRQLQLVNGLAVALIGFGAGMELDVEALSRQRRELLRHGGILISVLFVGLFLVTLAAGPWLPPAAGMGWAGRCAVALVSAAVMATFSPAVVMAVLSETGARGPLASRLLALVVMGDLVLVVGFTVATTAAHLLAGDAANPVAAPAHVIWEIVGSVGVGLAAGGALSVYQRLVQRQSALVVTAVCLVLAEVGSRLGLSALICCISAGLMVRAASPDLASATHHLLDRVRLPVLVIFFAAAGASFHLREIVALWPFALGLVLARAALIVVGNALAAGEGPGLPPEVVRRVPAGLLSQAGVTLGLSVLIAREFPAWGPS
ncbi:MAG: cation:proton antiporter, partial [Deltaproteobacteria bacterium]|nr:cation:proton antiporter [Deltaproteobacteria bacterium]